jgi:hypothetical protein
VREADNSDRVLGHVEVLFGWSDRTFSMRPQPPS